MPKKYLLLTLLTLQLSLSACATKLTANVNESQDMDDLGQIFVAHFEPDGRDIHKIIAEEFNALGYNATYGETEEKPKNADTVVTYADRWMWDMTMYMLAIDITLFDVNKGLPIADVHNMRTSLVRKTPRGMVRGALYELLGKDTPPEDVVKTEEHGQLQN